MKKAYSQASEHSASLFGWESETKEEMESIFPYYNEKQ